MTTHTVPPKPSAARIAYDKKVASYNADLAAWKLKYAAYQGHLATGGTCSSFLNQGSACAPLNKPQPPALPIAPTAGPKKPGQPATATPAPPPIQLTPQQVAEIAVAQLTVPTVKPGIGPPPEINQWNMAVVGYPLWLYADGATHLGPVAQTVGAQSVSLDAQLSSMTYQMGDGHSVTCAGAGTVWRRGATAPGTPSPTCGYHYEKASLPKGDYTVTAIATWSVTWTINGQTGVIPVYTNSSRKLPVGELQALVR